MVNDTDSVRSVDNLISAERRLRFAIKFGKTESFSLVDNLISAERRLRPEVVPL